MANMLLLDVEKQELREVECNSLDDYYKEIDCRCIDVKEVFVINCNTKKSMYIDVIYDDEFLLTSNRKIPSVLYVTEKNGLETFLLGNVIFARHNKDGEIESLSDEQMDFIKSCVEDIPFEVIDEITNIRIKMNCKMFIVSLR